MVSNRLNQSKRIPMMKPRYGEHGRNKQVNSQRPDLFSGDCSPRAVLGSSKASAPVKSSVQDPIIEELDTPEVRPSVDTTDKGKGILEAPVRTKAHTVVIPETTQKEMEEILKIIKRSDFDVVEQLW